MRATRYAALVALVALAGCAGSARSKDGGPLVSPSMPVHTAPPAASDWVEYAAEVTDVRPGPTDRTAVIVVSLPAGRDDCSRNDPKVTYQEESAQVIWANVVFSSAGSVTPHACPSTVPAEVMLTAAAPLGGRTLSLNSSSLWAIDGDRYHRCDSTLGCHPSADHCAVEWLDQAVAGMDVPRHSYRSVRSCDGTWLIMEINTAAANCPPRDGAGPTCTAPSNTTRWFLRFAPTGWRIITGSKRAGCTDVLARQPDFPTRLCSELGPVT